MPVAETVERVGLKPTTEPADAGAVIEPSVSVPMEAGSDWQLRKQRFRCWSQMLRFLKARTG